MPDAMVITARKDAGFTRGSCSTVWPLGRTTRAYLKAKKTLHLCLLKFEQRAYLSNLPRSSFERLS